MTTTNNLGVTLLEQSQSQKEVTINEALTTFDAMIGNTAISRSVATPPTTPATGDVYIVPASATGAWTGKDNKITYFDQIWRFITPRTNSLLWVLDANHHCQYSGTVWVTLATGSGDMVQSTYDPANIAQQLVGATATQTLTNKTISGASNSLTVRLANDVTGTLPVANGGTGQTSFTDGQLLIGNSTGNTLTKATLTAGSGINITNGSGAITIAATTPTSFSGALAGDVTGTQSATVVEKINGTSLAGLATGILKNTTTTGAPSIATAGTDYQAPITLTTTGTSGAATFVGNTLNIPQYAGGGGSSAFSAITSSTNTTAAMIVGTGASLAASGTGTIAATSVTGASTITSASSSALVVGASGATNPAFTVDASTASSATGLLVKSAAAAGGLAVSVQSSGSNENLTINAKGTGTISIGSVSTGAITLTRATTMSAGATIAGGAHTQSGGAATFTASASGTAATVRHSVVGAADAALTASTEAPNTYFNLSQTRQHATGALTLQRDFRISGSAHTFVGASTLTDHAILGIDRSTTAITNATITNHHGIYIPTAALPTGYTNSYGITVNATTGATNNYAANFNGTVLGTTVSLSGTLLAGSTSTPSATNAGVQLSNTNTISPCLVSCGATTTSTPQWQFINGNGVVGSIVTNGTATAFNTSSDYRLKENVTPLTAALDVVNSLKPSRFDWKWNGAADAGFIAHELQEVVPGAVTGVKDAVDADGKPIHQGIDTSFLVVYLVGAIQELAAKVEQLEAANG